MKIKNVIFDLGGVILKLDYKKTFLAFEKLGIHNIELTVRRHCLRILEDFETGKISINDFQSAIEQKINVKITTTEFEHAWNALILDIPVNHLQLIKHVKLSYKTYLLSNINALHYAAVQQLLQHQHQLTSLKDYFDKEYYSHLFGFRKPNLETFQKVLMENQLLANETVFIDDTLEHVEAATKIGLHTIHITNEIDLATAIKKLKKYDAE